MALPGELSEPLTVYRGDSFSVPFEFFTDTAKTVHLDLTAYGSSFAAQMRTAPRATVEIPFDLDDTDAATGRLVLALTPAQTAALIYGEYQFDIQATADPASVKTLIVGTVSVSGDITRV